MAGRSGQLMGHEMNTDTSEEVVTESKVDIKKSKRAHSKGTYIKHRQ